MKYKSFKGLFLSLLIVFVTLSATGQDLATVTESDQDDRVIMPDMLAPKYPGPGNFTIGLRSTHSMFGAEGYVGYGVGGQFRIRPARRINTEWFSDLIKTNLSNVGVRTDAHIGWSVLFYLQKEPSFSPSRFVPFIIAGHCFDYTRIESSDVYEYRGEVFGERWSSAVQMGAGSHIKLTERCDFSLNAQYMLHLGNDIHGEIESHNGLEELHIHTDEGAGLEGHLLVTFSINYKIADLW